ncbi:hypothetical protein J31TS4_26910 [Paenibacillus sp. J31TS4]|uniref:hypothetical protein n=1 Tax=Paenibacillus sp. J31TS4 TaxID=2807195 RepID=UPI001B1CBE00|nr:hypothetical protein [Paenibacillus sp. J31TS4]GIP39411.1 hypothetical protein J31TS4_26910 [Paenibacillus sp. J31TS4]
MFPSSRKWLAAGIVLCLLLSLAPLPGAQAESPLPNVLVNGSFEDASGSNVPGWSPDGDSPAVQVTRETAAERLQSLVLSNSSSQAIGVVSDAYSVLPFDNVTFTAKTRSGSGSGAKADVRFYDASGKLLSVVSGLVSAKPGGWEDVHVTASAPKDGALVRVAFHIPANKTALFYADAASLQVAKTPDYLTNLGPQSTSLTIMTGAYGKDKSGRDVMYTVAQGDPAQFLVSDVLTKEVRQRHALVALDGSNASAAWGITVATDGKVYIGSTPNGTLFQYDPLTGKMRTLGKPVPSDTIILVLVPGPDGKVYGGTGYSQSLFEYDPQTDRSTVLASFSTGPKEQHVRALAYDADRHALYVGGSDVAKLYRYDLATGTKTPIEHPGFAGKVAVYDLQYTAGKLFVRLNAGPVMYVYDPATGTWPVENNPNYNARGFSPVSPDNRVFYTHYETLPDGKNQWSLHAYDVTTDTYASLGVNVKGAAIAFGYVDLQRPDWPGLSLVGLAGNSGWAFYYNLETGKTETAELPLPPQFVELFNIGKGSDGRMLSSGFISGGGMGIYSPTRDETLLYPSLGQIEAYATLNGISYMGGYPGASLFRFDPAKPWNRTDPSLPQNPLRVKQLGYEQERPIAMVGVEELNKLYIGSYPIAGKVGGALSIYDPETDTLEVKRHLVPNHSVNTMLYRDGKLYLGTGAMDGGAGRLAVYDIASGEIEFETVPVAGKKGLAAFLWGPDGNLWGMAQGVLFVFDPVSRKVVYQDDKFPAADYVYANPHLLLGTDGNLYGSIFTGYVGEGTYVSKMFKVDAGTKDVTTILESNVEKLAQDDFGNFYFKYGSELIKYSDPQLVVKLASADLYIPERELTAGTQVQTGLTAILEKGRTTRELTGAAIEYTSSHSAVAEIDEKGVLHAYKPGSAKLSVRLTIQGVTVTSIPITVHVKQAKPNK